MHTVRLFITMFLAALTVAACAQDGNDELRSAPEWSVLQNLEVRYRGQTGLPVIVEKQERHCAAGIWAADRSTRVWILLDARYQPLVKKLPDGKYDLNRDGLKQILDTCQPTAKVLAELQNHLVE